MNNSGWRSAAATDRGNKRKINEDSILSRPEIGLWVAADGMGGHEAGDVASGMIVDTLAKLMPGSNIATVVDQIEDALINVNHKIRDYSERMYDGKTMGSTVVLMVIQDGMGVCMWAGDSRLYRIREGQIAQMNFDHSEVQELVDRGVISAEEAATYPDSNVITRAVGGAPDLFLDIVAVDLQKGDRFILCSDGLYNEVPTEEIPSHLEKNLETSVSNLIQATLDSGAKDNVSVLLIEV